MKSTRKLTALLAVVSLLCALWVPVTVSAEMAQPQAVVAQSDDLFYFGRSVLAQMDNSEALCYAYNKMVEGCEAVSGYIDIYHDTYRIDQTEASLVYRTVMADHPEFFWLSDGLSLGGMSGHVTVFCPYVYDGIAAKREELSARVAELTADLAGKSDADISRILHDRMCEITIYKANGYDQNAIGSLLMGKAVCAGYARGYQLLLQSLGIPCFYVTGYSRDQAHAWNLVQLDGEWYYTDVTWDDQSDTSGNIYYAYLNLTYDLMIDSHVPDSYIEYLPHSTATAANYHYQNGSILESWDARRIAALYQEGKPIRLLVTGDLNTFFADFNAHFGDLVQQLACYYSGYSCGTSYMGREIWLDIHLTHPHVYPQDGNVCKNCGFEKPTPEPEPDPEPEILLGDANGDGKVNNRDLGILQRYLNEIAVDIDLDAADMNGDGKLNNRDLGLLQRLLNA